MKKTKQQLLDEARAIHAKAEEEKRNLTADETREFNRLVREARLAEDGDKPQPRSQADPVDDRRGWTSERPELRAYTADESIAPAFRCEELPDGIRPDELSFGRWLRGVATGEWRGAEAEHTVARAMIESSDVAGGYAVPSPLFGQLVDLARAQSVLLRAGARTVPMESESLAIARVTGDLTPEWKPELAEASETGLTLGRRMLYAQHLYAYVPVSIELVEDAPNVGTALETAFSAGLALELDRAGLFGTGTGEPLGIMNDPDSIAVVVTGGGGNGSPLSAEGYYDPFSLAVQAVAEQNGAADVAILSPRDFGTLDRAKDGNAVPLTPPPSWTALRQRLVSTQVATNLAFGTAADASVAFVGDFSVLWLGLRQRLTIEATREGDENFRKGQVTFRARLRGDWTVVRGGQIAVIQGIIAES